MSNPAFPTLLKELYKEPFVKKPKNIISGFNKSVNSSTPKQDENNVEFSITNDTPRLNTAVDNFINSSNFFVNTPPVGPVTPRKALRRAILAAIQSTQSNLTASALQSAKKEKETSPTRTQRSFYIWRIIGTTSKGERKQKKELKQKQKKWKKQEITAMILMNNDEDSEDEEEIHGCLISNYLQMDWKYDQNIPENWH